MDLFCCLTLISVRLGVWYFYDKWHGSVIYLESITEVTKRKQVDSTVFGFLQRFSPNSSSVAVGASVGCLSGYTHMGQTKLEKCAWTFRDIL